MADNFSRGQRPAVAVFFASVACASVARGIELADLAERSEG